MLLVAACCSTLRPCHGHPIKQCDSFVGLWQCANAVRCWSAATPGSKSQSVSCDCVQGRHHAQAGLGIFESQFHHFVECNWTSKFNGVSGLVQSSRECSCWWFALPLVQRRPSQSQVLAHVRQVLRRFNLLIFMHNDIMYHYVLLYSYGSILIYQM